MATASSSDSAERRVWSVRALVSDILQHVETEYTDIWVEGEISNCRPAPSGHIYFTLKDGEAQLPVVLFRRQAGCCGFVRRMGWRCWCGGACRCTRAGGSFN